MRNLILVCLALPLAARAQDAPPKAETILDRYVEVTGGAAAYQKRHSVIEKGTIEMVGRGVKGDITNYMAEPDKAYSVMNLEGVGQMEEGSDGVVAWERSVIQGPRVKDGTEKTQALEESIFNAPIKWRQLYTKVTVAGSEEVNGEDCWKVEATPKSGNVETLFFSKKTGLQLKRSAVQVTQMGDIPAEAFLSDYKDNGGVLEPATVRQRFAGQEMVIHIDSTDLNPEIPASKFALPAEIQQLLKKPSPAEAPAAGSGTAGSGKLTVYMNGIKMATETYTFASSDGKYTWTGSGHAQMGPMELDIERYRIVTDEKYHPLEAELKTKMGQIAREVKTTFAGGKAHNVTETPKGPQVKVDDVSPDAVIMAFPLPVFPLAALARRISFKTGDPQEFHAYLLGQREVPVTVKYLGKDSVEFANQTAQLNHVSGNVELQAGQPLTVDLWEDDNRRIIRILAPSHHIDVYQEGYEPKPAPPETPAAPEPKPDPEAK
ncbi:MAG TPA: hypothetical protein VHD76_01215 [Bryobacteraceae bacterium]|jgi:hypothetical protein|nr:hypothetical protein [Bryobacteraceae bacterium]